MKTSSKAPSRSNRRREGQGQADRTAASQKSAPKKKRAAQTPTESTPRRRRATGAEPTAPRGNRRINPRPRGTEVSGETDLHAFDPAVPLRARVRVMRERMKLRWARAKHILLWGLRASAAVALIVAAIAGGRLVERHVRTSPAFATQTIEVTGFERLTEAQVLETSGLAVGQNAFALSVADATERLRNHPWIASAEVTRRLPGHFSVHIREHRPVALVALKHLYLLSEDGTLFRKLSPGDPVDLPVVTGIELDRLKDDPVYRSAILLEVVALMHEYRAAGLWRRAPIAEIRVGQDDSLSLYFGEDATLARLGRGPFQDKLRRLRRVLDRLDREKAEAAYVLLDNTRRPDRVTVRLR